MMKYFYIIFSIALGCLLAHNNFEEFVKGYVPEKKQKQFKRYCIKNKSKFDLEKLCELGYNAFRVQYPALDPEGHLLVYMGLLEHFKKSEAIAHVTPLQQCKSLVRHQTGVVRDWFYSMTNFFNKS